MEATPHRWFAGTARLFPLLNLLDDCSRVYTASEFYERELLVAHLDLLPAAFLACGLPLALLRQEVAS